MSIPICGENVSVKIVKNKVGTKIAEVQVKARSPNNNEIITK